MHSTISTFSVMFPPHFKVITSKLYDEFDDCFVVSTVCSSEWIF